MRQSNAVVEPSIRRSCIISALSSLVYYGCSTHEFIEVHMPLENSDAAIHLSKTALKPIKPRRVVWH
jgi:hypothetical protein